MSADSLERAERDGSLQPHRVAKDAIAGFKKKLPGFTVSGQFKKRAASDLIVHSGIFCVDMDLVSPEEQPGLIERLKEDPHVQVVFVSPSGWGLKVLVSIQPDPANHLRSYYAVERYFKETYVRTIDEQCKDVSRLCFSSSDPRLFIRQDRAKIIKPIEREPETAAPHRQDASGPAITIDGVDVSAAHPTGQHKSGLPTGLLYVPGGSISITRAACSILGAMAKHSPPCYFIQAGRLVRISADNKELREITPSTFRTEAEAQGTLFQSKKGPHGEFLLQPHAIVSENDAKGMLDCQEACKLLPENSLLHSCPLLIEDPDTGQPKILLAGYHSHNGGRYVTATGVMPELSLEQAIDTVLALFDEYSFVSPSDRSRAVAALLSPALKMGGILKAHFPIFTYEADHEQTGKGHMTRVNHALYNERPSVIAKRKGGVGSFDEDLGMAILKGRAHFRRPRSHRRRGSREKP